MDKISKSESTAIPYCTCLIVRIFISAREHWRFMVLLLQACQFSQGTILFAIAFKVFFRQCPFAVIKTVNE